MTDNQERAYEYLERYHQAKQRERGLDRQVETLRSEAESIRSASAVDLGWTGQMQGNKKVMAPVLKGGGHAGNDRMLDAYCTLADKSSELDDQRELTSRLLTETESEIDRLVDDETRRAILKLRHIDRLDYELIGETVRYSISHTRKIYHESLEELGARL